MARFQAIAVGTARGPVVTMQAGVELGGRYWATTSHTAAKVAAIRRTRVAAVLSPTDDGWTLRIGRAVVLDPRHPLHGFRDPVGSAWGMTALARIVAAYPEQLFGYATDGAVPAAWNAVSRVLIAVRGDHMFSWRRDGSAVHPSGTHTPNWVLDPQARGTVPDLDGDHRDLVHQRGPCWLGVTTARGPAAVPATLAPGGIVRAHTGVLHQVGALLPGVGCVTIDRSASPRPSEKIGVILRGVLTPRSNRAGFTALAMTTTTATTWTGFATHATPSAS